MAYMSWYVITFRSDAPIETGCYFDADRPWSEFCVYNLRENGDFAP